jgi:hypothetical protein
MIEPGVSGQPPIDWPTLVAAVAVAVSAGFAGLQLWLGRRDANRRAVLDLLRDVDAKSRDVIGHSVQYAKQAIITCYRDGNDELPQGAMAYLALLSSLDLLAFATAKGLAEATLVNEHVETLLRPSAVSLNFL